jgi:fused signal recognition particle receptor
MGSFFFEVMGIFSPFFGKKEQQSLDEGLTKTREGLWNKVARTLVGRTSVDDDFLDELEEILVTADVGLPTTVKIIDRLKARVSSQKYLGQGELQQLLETEISALLQPVPASFLIPGHSPSTKPYVWLVVGVNGVGKTTTIGKLAQQFQKAGLQVMLGAADTFRAAAVDQLKVWGERASVPVVSQGMGADPAAVAYETVQRGLSAGVDVILIDTAGRLHNKVNLMQELGKIKRVIEKLLPEAPHEVMLVLDASTGQNAFEQAKAFTAATEVTSLAVTKLDGTAKGGVVIGVSDQFSIPVRFIGVGEGIDQLQVFHPQAFVEALFKKDS